MKALRTTQINLYYCDTKKIDDVDTCRNFLIDLVKLINMNMIPEEMIGSPNPIIFSYVSSEDKNEDGVTGVIILCESHTAIHTWPKKEGFAEIVINSCKDYDPKAAADYCYKFFGAKRRAYDSIYF
jgi:S-adenosylmethionine decarboxylase